MKPGKALDLGVGKFYDVAGMKLNGWRCEGVDKTTGVDLEKKYLSPRRPFDLVYSNYVLHKLKKPEQLLKTANLNLKPKGWLFLHTFDQTDKISKTKFSKIFLTKLLKKTGFQNISTYIFSFYDNEPGHKHWHRILEATAQKRKVFSRNQAKRA